MKFYAICHKKNPNLYWSDTKRRFIDDDEEAGAVCFTEDQIDEEYLPVNGEWTEI